MKKNGWNPDLLYGRDINSFRALADTGVPMIYESHYIPRGANDIATFEYVLRCKSFKRLVVITKVLQEEYKKLFPWLPDSKILVAQNVTDIPNPMCQDIPDWPGRHGHLQVGYVGQLYRGKGMEIINQVVLKAPDIDFHIVGGMPKDIEYWRKQCRADNIFFHGYIDHGSLGGYFQKFDVLLAPYVSGSINSIRSPLKVFEYMARQKPIVASDIPIIREVLRNEENSLLVVPEDIDAWVRALTRLRSDSVLGQNIAERAYQDFLSLHTWPHRVKQILDGV